MLDFVTGSDRDSRLGYDDSRLDDGIGYFLARRIDIAEIGMTIAPARRGTHRDKNGITVADGFREIGRKGEPLCIHIALHQIGQPRFVDRHDIVVEVFDLLLVLVDADHIMAEIGEAGARNQADIARTYHCKFHSIPSNI